MRISYPNRSLALVAAVAGLVAGAGCIVTDDGAHDDRAQPRVGQLTPEQIKSEMWAFNDRFAELISQAFDELQLEDRSIEVRRLVSRARLDWTSNALHIATSPNPVTGLLDMTVMVSLQRIIWEEFWVPEILGERGAQITSTIRTLEDEVWSITGKVLDEEQRGALKQLTLEIRERYPEQVYVSGLRASEFAEERNRSGLRIKGSGSLLSLFGLDPMSNLTPATRQIAESRLLGERAFYYGQRLPRIVQWRVEDAVLTSFTEPELQRLIGAADTIGEASREYADLGQMALDGLPLQREAAIDQAAQRLSEEREAAIDQLFEGLESERRAILEDLRAEETRLRGVLAELRETIRAGDALSASMETTLASATTLTESIRTLKESARPDARPFDITEYRDLTESASGTLRELNAALVSANELLASPEWDRSGARVEHAAATGRAELERIVDRLADKALLVVLVFLAGLLGVLLIYRVAATRLITPRPDR